MKAERDEWLRRVLGVDVPAMAPACAGRSPLQVWLDAKEAAGAQISSLQDAMRSLGHPVFARIADQGLNAITGRLQVGLQAALMDLERGGDASARRQARQGVAELRAFLASDPVLPMLDANPLGVAVTLRAGLGRALEEIDRALAA